MLYPVFYKRFQVCLYLEGTHSPCFAAHVLLISFIRFFSFLFYAFSMVRSGFVRVSQLQRGYLFFFHTCKLTALHQGI